MFDHVQTRNVPYPIHSICILSMCNVMQLHSYFPTGLTLLFTVCCVCIQAKLNADGTSTGKVTHCTSYCGEVPDKNLGSSLTPEFLLVGRYHHRELPGMGIMQAGEKLLLSCRSEKVFLLLVACQVHHPCSDVDYYEHLKREKYENVIFALAVR